MQLKKWGMIGLCVLMVAGSAGCTPKETETVKTEIEEPEEEEVKKEEPKEKLPREIKQSDLEQRKYFGNKVVELYPEIDKMKTYLFQTYADVLPSKEATFKLGKSEKPVVDIGYTGGGGDSPYMGITVSFKENATKEQRIEVCNYIIGELQKLFPPEKQTYLSVTTLVNYAVDGTQSKEVSVNSLGIQAELPVNVEEIKWKVSQAPDFKWTEVTDPYADPVPAETADGLLLSKLLEELAGVDVKETGKKDNEYGKHFSAGQNDEGYAGYLAEVDDNENVQSVNYWVEKQDDMTMEQFANIANLYLMICARIPYGDTDMGAQAFSFIMNNMEATLTEEQTTIIGEWNIKFSFSKELKSFFLEFSK